MRFLFLLSFLAFARNTVESAPYPEEGRSITWEQPSGTRLTLRVFGDEFYARTETVDGYTVIFEPSNKTYYYAIKGSKEGSLISSNVAAGKLPPSGLPKHLEESPTIVAAKRAQNIQRYAPDRFSDWAARKKAVREAKPEGTDACPSATVPVPSPGSPATSNESVPFCK